MAARITAGVLAMVAASAAMLLIVENTHLRDHYLNERRIDLEHDLQDEKLLLDRTIDSLRRDTLFMANTPAISGIMRATLNHGVDSRDSDTRKKWKNRAQGIFSAFLTANPDYHSISYIGLADGGREIVRVDSRAGQIEIMPPSKLSAPGEYFKHMSSLREEQVYLSEFYLSQDMAGQPHKPTLSAFTPIYTPSGERFGMVTISMDAGPMLKAATHNPSHAQGYMANRNGQYLIHPDARQALQLDPDSKAQITRDFPFILTLFDPQTPDYMPLQVVPTKVDGSLFAARRVHFDPSDPQRFLLLMDYLPGDLVALQVGSISTRSLVYEFMAMLSVGTIALFALRRTFSPLKQITEAANKISAGDLSATLPQRGNGEIGSLALALDTMLIRLAQREKLLLKSENKYRTLLENIPQKIFYKDTNSVYISCNKNFADDLKIKPDEITGKTDFEFFPAELAEKYRGDDKRLMALGEPEDIEELYIQGEKSFWVRTLKTPVVDIDGKISGILGIFWDITVYKQAGNMLRLHSTILNNLSEGVFLTRASDAVIVYTNPQLERMFGYDPDELTGRQVSVLSAFSTDNPVALSSAIEGALRQSGEWSSEIQCTRKDGSTFLCYAKASAFNHPQFGEVWVSNCEDITERKEAERQLQELGMHLQSVIEEERTRIARELHDELGQSMTALRFDLKWLNENIPVQELRAHEKFHAMENLLGKTVDAIRRISEDLRPGILDDIGLAAAIESHVAKFVNQYGIACDLMMNQADFDLEAPVATALFRIVQESLTNVARHSGASQTIIRLQKIENHILLIVQDNGRGIRPEKNAQKKTYGLLGMRERVKMLNGTLDVFNEEGAGVRIEACVPKRIKE